MPSNIKQLLSAYDVPSKHVTLIEDYYNDMMGEVLKEQSKKQKEDTKQQKTDTKAPSLSELAQENRIIK